MDKSQKTKELQKFFFLNLLPAVLKMYVNYIENVPYIYFVF